MTSLRRPAARVLRAGCAAAAPLLLVVGLAGCSSARPGGDGWWPSGAGWRAALREAVRDPHTWVPAAGAVAIAAGDWDRSISRWAVRETPVFSSPERAADASDTLRGATGAAMVLSVLAVGGGERVWRARGERLLVDYGALALTDLTTRGLKRASRRLRPDRSDRSSFPSGHSSRAFADAALTRGNLDESDAVGRWRRPLAVGVTVLAGASAWARVEAGVHYPSDVLAGAALGNLLAVLVQEAFTGSGTPPLVAVAPRRGGVAITVSLRAPRGCVYRKKR